MEENKTKIKVVSVSADKLKAEIIVKLHQGWTTRHVKAIPGRPGEFRYSPNPTNKVFSPNVEKHYTCGGDVEATYKI